MTSFPKCSKPDPAAMAAAIKKLDSFTVDTIDIDYYAKCKARIIDGEKKHSGSCQLILTRNHELQLTILHPLGGTLLRIYADQKIIQVNDYTEQRFYQYPAKETDKLDIPVFRNLTIKELQAIMWGRITEATTGLLEFELENKKPMHLYKKSPGLDLTIIYKKWQQKAKLSIPRIIEMKNKADGSSIKLVITDFKPGYFCDLKLENSMASK
jgi:outer membrane biogenesis lipoprotein LolB